jgi:RND family efflux transporter MFP subunit
MKLNRACIVMASALAIIRSAAAPAFAADGPPVPVVVTTARSENVGASLAATGTVVSRNDARISAEVAGTLAWIAEPGSTVKRGATIARIDPERLALTLRDNDAALKRLEAQLSLLATQRTRLQTLGNVVSQSQLDEALSREHMAEQDVEQARVARDRARLDVDRASVRAPFDGIVAERLQQSGEYVAGGSPLLRLVNDRDLEVVARAPLTTADSVSAGAVAQLIDGDHKTSGKVRAVIPVGDERSRMVELRIALTLTDRSWRVGAPVRVEIAPRILKAVVTVPRDAVIQRQGASYVMRVRADNTAERVAVNIGPGYDNHVQIGGTLRAGDRVVIRGAERLEPGQTVEVKLL